MRVEDDAGFVLHRRAYGESSVTLELFTERLGRVAAIAKGARSMAPRSGKDSLGAGTRYQFSLAGNGELLQLRRFEASQVSPLLQGEASLALMYINELLVHLLPRGDSHPQLLHAYQELLPALSQPSLAFNLRCFERGLLDSLGYGIDFSNDVDGASICPGNHYRLDADAGFSLTQAEALHAIAGQTILAFFDAELARSQTLAMRLLMRSLISPRLEGRSLRSWDLMRDLNAMRTQSP
jgi:DNA repair protein RecO (recombination protein O)